MLPPWMFPAFVLLRITLALIFLASGAVKLLTPGSYDQLFHLNLYPSWLTYVIGTIEILGAIGLVFTRLRAYAAYVLLPVMAGAVWTKLRAPQGEAAPYIELPILLLVALLAVLIEAAPWDGDRPPRYRRPAIPLPRVRRRPPPPR